MKSNYLKYWRVIRYFIKAKYKLTQAELDVLLFLHDEKYFSKEKFEEFNNLLSWDVNRFDKLLRDLTSIYNKLSGEEIPTSQSANPMFAKHVSYSDKVYRNMILEMNKFIKQQRHLSLE
jgi:hypothetical protein